MGTVVSGKTPAGAEFYVYFQDPPSPTDLADRLRALFPEEFPADSPLPPIPTETQEVPSP